MTQNRLRCSLSRFLENPMGDVKEPKKETVRITLPPRPASNAPASNGGQRDTVRINLPARSPSSDPSPRVAADLPKPPAAPRPIARPSVLPGLGQPPKGSPLVEISPNEPGPSAAQAPSASPVSFKPPSPPAFKKQAIPEPSEFSAPQPIAPSPGPKKETARIEMMPQRSSAAPTVKMAKTQPLITAPAASEESAPVFVAPSAPDESLDSIPMSLCWGLLAISALLFIIQLWIYFS